MTARPSLGFWPACLLSLLLIVLASAVSNGGALSTLGLDLKHRWVAVAAGRGQPAVDLEPDLVRPGSTQGPQLGANTFLEQEAIPERREESIELLKAAGVTWIRQQLPWEEIEPDAKGSYVDSKFGGSTWAKYDDIVERANAVGIQVVFRLDTTPVWARPAGATDDSTPPEHDADYWDFVQAVAQRYRSRVAGYQIWNEPNLSSEWGGQAPAPADYARLLEGAAQRVHAADPQAVVAMAALAPTLTQSTDAEDDLLYLQQLYDAGVKGSFDVLAVQAYGLRGGPDDPRIDNSDVTFSRPERVRDLMVRNGDAATPMWATEFGWDAPPADMAVQRFGWVTPVLQARYTARAIERVAQQWPWLERLGIWYFKRVDEADAGQDWYWFRLASSDFALQPVYYAVRDASAVAR